MFSSNDYDRIWADIYEALLHSGELSSDSLNLWFRDFQIVLIDGDSVVFSTSNAIKKQTVLTKYLDLLVRCTASVIPGCDSVEVIEEKRERAVPLEGEGTVHSPMVRARDLAEETLRTASEPDEEPLRPRSGGERRLSYNGDYTFENFIVGNSNKFAHAAALAVANNPATKYNPLLFYGPSGLGKTHLMYAITNKLFEVNPDLNAIYVNGEDFTNQLIESITRQKNAEFREKYRKADILLIDDIQFIAGKEATQEEFFHTFNALYQDHKQIFLSSDRPPKEMVTLEERIRTRLEQGLLADIQLPDYELRLAILKSKAESMDMKIGDDVLSYIAEKLLSNIRQLEGIIKRISATHLLDGAKIDMDLARSLVPMFQQETEPVGETAEKIIAVVAARYGITPEDITGTQRTKNIKTARNLAMYLIRQVTELSLPSIGAMFGGRDHSTVHSNISALEKQLKQDSALEMEISDIRREIKR